MSESVKYQDELFNEQFFNSLGFKRDQDDFFSKELQPGLTIAFDVVEDFDNPLGKNIWVFENKQLALNGYWDSHKDFVDWFSNILPQSAAEYLKQ